MKKKLSRATASSFSFFHIFYDCVSRRRRRIGVACHITISRMNDVVVVIVSFSFRFVPTDRTTVRLLHLN